MIVNEFDFSNQLACFFNDWKRIEQQQQAIVREQLSFEERLDLFFNEWRNSTPIEEVLEQSLLIDNVALENFFQGFDIAVEPIRAAKKQGFALNVWKAAGLKKDEVKNGQVLKWLLDCHGDHGQGNKILKLFLSLLPEQFQQPKRPTEKEEKDYLRNYNVTAESHYFAENDLGMDVCKDGSYLSIRKNSRIDIEIDATEFLLFIEIKINANEGQDQLQRYLNIAQARRKDRNCAVIYLTKDGKLPKNYQIYESHKKLVGVSWQDVSKKLHEYAKSSDVNNRSAWLVKQFADHIKTF